MIAIQYTPTKRPLSHNFEKKGYAFKWVKDPEVAESGWVQVARKENNSPITAGDLFLVGRKV